MHIFQLYIVILRYYSHKNSAVTKMEYIVHRIKIALWWIKCRQMWW